MSSIEKISAPCPNCSKALYQKHQTSGYGLMFDACVHCGYIQSNCNGEALTLKEAWISILAHNYRSTNIMCSSVSDLAIKDKSFRVEANQADKPIFIPNENITDQIFSTKEYILMFKTKHDAVSDILDYVENYEKSSIESLFEQIVGRKMDKNDSIDNIDDIILSWSDNCIVELYEDFTSKSLIII